MFFISVDTVDIPNIFSEPFSPLPTAATAPVGCLFGRDSANAEGIGPISLYLYKKFGRLSK
jgi:hypothetical protein